MYRPRVRIYGLKSYLFDPDQSDLVFKINLETEVIDKLEKSIDKIIGMKREYRKKELEQIIKKKLKLKNGVIERFIRKYGEYYIALLHQKDWENGELNHRIKNPVSGWTETRNVGTKKRPHILSIGGKTMLPIGHTKDLKVLSIEEKNSIADFLFDCQTSCSTYPLNVSVVAHSTDNTFIDEAMKSVHSKGKK